MMLQMAWKEYREHRPVWLAMAAIGALLVIGMAVVLPALESNPSAQSDLLNMVMAAVGAVMTYGLVCGAMMFAGERETGTLAFLESLTGRHLPVWRAKVLAGALFCILQGLAVAGVALAVAPESQVDPIHGLWLLPLVALDAFVWGLLASSLCRSVLTAAGLAVLFWIAGLMVVMPCSFLGWPVSLGFRVLLACLALPCSAALFQRSEPPRVADLSFVPRPRRVESRPPASWQVLLWLPLRQGWGLALVLAILTLPMGLFLVPAGPLWWLAFSVLVGVLCGTATFGSEQSEGSNRFLGNQRFPLGRVWAVKTAYWLAVASAVLALFVIVGVVSHMARNVGTSKHSHSEEDPDGFAASFLFTPQNWLTFAPLGLAYGFAIGQFYSVIWRKSVVAVVVALLVSPAAVGVWLPSVIWGGLPLWQVLLPPALLLATTRMALWDWASVGLGNWRPGLKLAAGGLLAAGAIGAALGYRVLELPEIGEPFDSEAFKASLPDDQHNSGRKIATAAGEIDKVRSEADQLRPRQPLFPGGKLDPNATFTTQAREAIEKGWPAQERELSNWLDKIFQQQAVTAFLEAVAGPPGFIDDPTMSLQNGRSQALKCKDVAELFEVRALQLQARGDDEAALDHLLVLLPLSQHLRNRAVATSYHVGVVVETGAARGLERWLASKTHDPKALRRLLRELARHDAEVPPRSEAVKAEYLHLRGYFEGLPQQLRTTGHSDTEVELFNASWAAPWEKERQLRLVNALCAAALKWTQRDPWEIAASARERADGPGIENPDAWRARGCGLDDPNGPAAMRTAAQWGRLLNDSPLWNHGALDGLRIACDPRLGLEQVMSLCRIRALRIVTALALHETEHGQPARELEDLVRRGYLPSVPVDPFSGEAFHYRLSTGEQINCAAENEEGALRPCAIPAGRGILWSVGPDGVDDGGVNQASLRGNLDAHGWARQKLDIIYLVPR
jgi:hypothetical protein